MGAKDTPNEPTQKKLRLSCDSCLAAKVKCAKERPTCSRCIDLGNTCVYSRSKRAGKPKGSGKNKPAAPKSPPTPLASIPASPPAPSGISMDWEETPWNLDIAGGPFPSHSDPGLVNFDSTTSSTTPLNQNFQTPSFSRNGSLASQEGMNNAFPNMFDPGMKVAPDWMSGLDMNSHQDTYPLELLTSNPSVNSMVYSGFTSDSSTPNDGSNASNADSPPASCNCLRTLQETRSALSSSELPFDQLIATNKSVVTCMSNYLSCSCVPDVLSLMLLSLIITRLVQLYKTINRGESEASKHVGVTMGTLQIDSDEEHQIKLMLIRSGLLKIKSLISRFHSRFESYLQGSEWLLYKANVEFLETDLEKTIKDVPMTFGTT